MYILLKSGNYPHIGITAREGIHILYKPQYNDNWFNVDAFSPKNSPMHINMKYMIKENEEYNKVISLLIKEPYNRTNEENIDIGDFLAKKYISFETLKNNDEEKYNVIISICHLKKYSANNIIINYENILDKQFFLLEGNIILIDYSS